MTIPTPIGQPHYTTTVLNFCFGCYVLFCRKWPCRCLFLLLPNHKIILDVCLLGSACVLFILHRSISEIKTPYSTESIFYTPPQSLPHMAVFFCCVNIKCTHLLFLLPSLAPAGNFIWNWAKLALVLINTTPTRESTKPNLDPAYYRQLWL